MLLWITGSKGLLGSSLSAKCNGVLKFLQTGREVNIADLTQVRGFVKKHPKITHIVNCAAFSEVDAAENMHEEAFQTNAQGPENLGKAANEIGAKFIHISTDYVFSGKAKRPLTEKDPVGPCSYYGATKLEGESKALDLGACVIRTSWLFGSNGKTLASKLLKMLQTQKEVRLTEDQWGRFTYAPDLADAILKMLDHAGLYQFANEGISTRYEFGMSMIEEAFLLGYPIMTESLIAVPGSLFKTATERPMYSAFDTTKIEPFVQNRHWKEALKDFLCAQMPVFS